MSNSDYLIHWKYIKRKRVGDKWKYWYPDDSKGGNKRNIVDRINDKLGVDEKQELDKAKAAQNQAKNNLITATKNYQAKRAEVSNKTFVTNSGESLRDQQARDAANKGLDPLRKEVTKAQTNAVEIGKKVVEAQKAFNETPIGKVSAMTDKISAGMTAARKAIFGLTNEEKIAESEKWWKNYHATKNKDADESPTSEQRSLIDDVKKFAEDRKRDVEAAVERGKEIVIRKAELERLKAELEKNNPLPELPLKKEATTIDEDMALINPGYDRSDPSTSSNCIYCTYAYELRRRGYDVDALNMGSEESALSMLDCFEVKHDDGNLAERAIFLVSRQSWELNRIKPAKSAEQLVSEIEEFGEGARGSVNFYWKNGGAHSIAWEVVNGKVEFRDCQVNEVININDYAGLSNRIHYVRLDDLTPNKKMLKKTEARG